MIKINRIVGLLLALVLTQNEVAELANLAYFEANTESDYGRRLVVDCVLNRIESEDFPDTVSEVIHQKGQFVKCKETDIPKEFFDLVREEVECRTNEQVLWFRTGRYHSWGDPILHEGAHYFSGLKGAEERCRK